MYVYLVHVIVFYIKCVTIVGVHLCMSKYIYIYRVAHEMSYH